MKSWRELVIGGTILEAGNSIEYETGSWRSSRPVLDEKKCSHCMLCWVFCPEGSVLVKDEKVVGFDLAHCKGCGICSTECPRKAITIVDELNAKKGAEERR